MIMQVQHLYHALIIHTGDYIMFKFLFRPSRATIRAGLQRYVDMEYRPADRPAAFARLFNEATR
jgi:hypothetical protein